MVERVLALVGPTASGKSRLAVAAAIELGAEIVAVDAFTVYRGMDIGTAKPTPAARQGVPHHMIDVLDPTQDCTVQWFQRESRRAIDEIRLRGRLPFLVGGSGLYFRAVVDPLEFPPTDPALRAELHARHRDDPEGAYRQLSELDRAAASRIAPSNLRRVVRALEVVQLTGRPFSAWRRSWTEYRSIYEGLCVVGVDLPREQLGDRIAQRTERMLEQGLVDEARALLGQRLSATARQAIGYAEAFEHLAGHTSLAETAEAITTRTRRYAARQQRWFRNDPRVQWTAPDQALSALVSTEG